MLTDRTPATARIAGRALQDSRVDVKIVLSALWAAMLFVFVYVDVFAFWRADVIQGALDGAVPGGGPSIGQAFLTGALSYVLVPILMIVVSLVTRARVNRRVNLVVSIGYAVSIVGLAIGDEWAYYLLGSVVEVLLLLVVVRTAWRWPLASGGSPQITATA